MKNTSDGRSQRRYLFILFLFVLQATALGSENGTLLIGHGSAAFHAEGISTLLNCSSTTESMFHCNVSQCLALSAVCNGIPDCVNGEDEFVNQCGCLPNEFRCRNSCIDMLNRCDRHADCEDGEDEIGCETHLCPISHFKCSNHYCIPLDLVCNFIDDCGDNSDELKCTHRRCWNPEFPCKNGQCIRPGFICDGTANCIDGSDEADCEPENFVTCGDGTLIHRHYWCDDWPDCPDNHADELHCNQCIGENQFLCSSGRCIHKSNVCDGQCDCVPRNSSQQLVCEDEVNCDSYYSLQAGTTNCKLGISLNCYIPVQERNKDRCIRREFICDGRNDCNNGDFLSDEFGCFNGTAEIPYLSFRCKDGRYLPIDLRCDYKYDCLHGDDEVGCAGVYECKSNEFKCNNGQCINQQHSCNRHFDCWDKSDEINCHETVCPSGWVRCLYGGQCIPQYKWCDFYKDCPDSSDEANCERPTCRKDQFRCDNGQCISQSGRCINNGQPKDGCADLSHLSGCTDHVCEDEYYKCHRGPCLNKSLLCDGNIDCRGTWDDEDNCSFSCARSLPQCQCRDVHINCSNLSIDTFPYDAEKEITWFHLGGNQLNDSVTEDAFQHLDHIIYLDLSNNSINELLPFTFSNLWRLNVLDLQNNRITFLTNNTFYGLASLKGLHLQGNRIKYIRTMAFYGLSSMTTLDLRGQGVQFIEKEAFLGLRNLIRLDLSRNEITHLNDGTFLGMPGLLHLDLSKNRLRLIEGNVFRVTLSLTNLVTDEFRFCCLARHIPTCLPPPDEFSSCEDLMSNIVLRICIWVLGIIATFMNGLVIVFRTYYKNTNQVHSFLITNLAVGDLLMGLYLLIIAFVDWHYRGIYFIHDSDWKSSQLCSFAGFISTFSSELSVFTLTVITLDRFLVIIFPFRMRRLEMTRTRVLMTSGWILAAVISILPLPFLKIEYFRNFYGRSGVCLPLHITPDKPNGWEYSVFVFLFLNFLSFTIIACSYLWMFLVARTTTRAVKRESRTSESVMACRMTLLVATDAACWIPIILLGIWSLAGFTVPSQVFAWVAVFVLPLNAALNPVLYTMSTAPFMKPSRTNIKSFRRSLSVDNRRCNSVYFRRNNSRECQTAEEIYSLTSRSPSIRWQKKIDTVVVNQGEVMPLKRLGK